MTMTTSGRHLRHLGLALVSILPIHTLRSRPVQHDVHMGSLRAVTAHASLLPWAVERMVHTAFVDRLVTGASTRKEVVRGLTGGTKGLGKTRSGTRRDVATRHISVFLPMPRVFQSMQASIPFTSPLATEWFPFSILWRGQQQ